LRSRAAHFLPIKPVTQFSIPEHKRLSAREELRSRATARAYNPLKDVFFWGL
jgi:hypothetical protein